MTESSMPQSQPHGYRPASTLALWTSILIAANVLCYIVAVPLNVYVVSLMNEMKRALQSGEGMASERFEWLEQLGWGFAVISAISFLLAMVLIACWIYRAQKNARALGVKDIRYSPAMAVGSFFVPVVSLFMPYQAMKQMLAGSLALTGEPVPRATLLIWWLAFLAGLVSSRISRVMIDKAKLEPQHMAQLLADTDAIVRGIRVDNFACVCLGVSACLLFSLIRRTERAHRQLAEQQGLQPI